MLEVLPASEKLADVVFVVFVRERRARHTRRIALCGAAFEPSAEDPAERMRLVRGPMSDEAVDGASQLVEGSEGAVLQHTTREDAEPDLNLVDPRRVQRRVEESEAIAMTEVERLPCRAVMDVEVVPDDGDVARRVLLSDALHEAHQVDRLASLGALTEHVAGVRIECC